LDVPTGTDPKPVVSLEEIGRRAFLKGTAVSAVVVVGSGDYVKPALRFLGVARGQAVVSPLPHSGGDDNNVGNANHDNNVGNGNHSGSFWLGRATGSADEWWSAANDGRWVQNGGQNSNPFQHSTSFSPFFTEHGDVRNLTMWAVLDGTGGSSARSAARELIAAYLNATFDHRYSFTPATLKVMWTTAVTHGDRALDALGSLLHGTNTP
jgi:hypothetical protein